MNGTTKQIEWAEHIRSGIIDDGYEMNQLRRALQGRLYRAQRDGLSRSELTTRARLLGRTYLTITQQTDATWWINHRSHNAETLLTTVAKTL